MRKDGQCSCATKPFSPTFEGIGREASPANAGTETACAGGAQRSSSDIPKRPAGDTRVTFLLSRETAGGAGELISRFDYTPNNQNGIFQKQSHILLR